MPAPAPPDAAAHTAAIRRMFAAIAPRYDLLTRRLAFRREVAWRRAAAAEAANFLLRAHRPQLYRETTKLEHSGPDGAPLHALSILEVVALSLSAPAGQAVLPPGGEAVPLPETPGAQGPGLLVEGDMGQAEESP